MDHDGTHALIGDLYRCGLAILNAGIDGGGVERITVCRFAFNNGVPSTFRVRNTDDAISVGGVGANDLTIHLADLELDIPNSLTSVFVGLDDLQSTGRGIVEGQGLEVVGVDDNSLTASVLIDDVAGERLGFCNNKSSDQPGDQYLSILIGSVDAVGADLTVLVRNKAAVSIGYFEWVHRSRRPF